MSAQCIQSVTIKSLFFHLSAFLWCCFGTYQDQFSYHSPNFLTYGGRFKYLTHCTAYLCLVVYGFAFLVDLLHLLTTSGDKDGSARNNPSFLILIRDYLVTMWSSNLSVFVVLMFWAVAAVDLEGIHPEEHQKIVPLMGWFNHYLHTVPAVWTTLLLTNVNYQRQSFRSTVLSAILFGAFYFSWMKHISVVLGNWPYIFIDDMSGNAFAGFVFVAHVMILAIDLFNRWVSRLAWGDTGTEANDKVNKKRI